MNQDNLPTLSQGPDFQDITYVCNDNQTVQAHKAILSLNGPILMKMNYQTNPQNLLKKLSKQSMKKPMTLKPNKTCMTIQFSAGAYSEVILPLMLSLIAGNSDECGETKIYVDSNEPRADRLGNPDSNILRATMSTTDERAEVTVHFYLHRQTMLVQGEKTFKGLPVWMYFCQHYLTPF